MILVADSGSSKADWNYVDHQGEETMVTSIGVNPNLHSPAEIRTVLESACPEQIASAKIEEVYYYGTGIWDGKRKRLLSEILQACYPNAKIEVYHDLLGAARAACGKERGVACILGTGSNSCLYDGTRVVDNVTNLGWLLGDEGSGTDLGKRLIRAYSYRELSKADSDWFEEQTGYNKVSIGDSLYGKASANRFLASFSPFIHDSLSRPAFRQIVVDAFSSFLQAHVLKYPEAQQVGISFIGSIGHYYADILREACASHDLTCASIKKKPIAALTSYHRS